MWIRRKNYYEDLANAFEDGFNIWKDCGIQDCTHLLLERIKSDIEETKDWACSCVSTGVAMGIWKEKPKQKKSLSPKKVK
jgi:hypothetical protein